MSNEFWIGQQSHSRAAVWAPSASESCRAHAVLARGNYWIGRLLLVLALGACATTPPVHRLPPPSAQDPRDLALHIIEVNSDGKGDEVNRDKIVGIEKANYPFTNREQESDIRICEEAVNLQSSAVILREQFICVIRNAIEKLHTWSDPGRDGRLCQDKNKIESCQDKPLKIAFYFNGGLNKKSAVTEMAGSTYRKIEDAGVYPVYMIWPTGGPQSYGEDVLRVRAGRLTKWYNWSTWPSTPVRPLSDLLRGIASAPAAWATSFYEFSQTSFNSKSYMMKRDWKLHVNEGKPIAAGQTVPIDPNRDLYFSPWEQEFQISEADDAPPDGEPVADFLVQDGGAATAKELASFAYHGVTAPVRALTTVPMVGLGEAGWRNVTAGPERPFAPPVNSPKSLPRALLTTNSQRRAREVMGRMQWISHPRKSIVKSHRWKDRSCGVVFRAAAAGSPECSSGWRAA